MASETSPTNAAAAVSQALGEIGLPPTRKPTSSILTAGRTIPQRNPKGPTVKSRAAFSPGSYGRPWKMALGNQLQHGKNENHPVPDKKRDDTNAAQTQVAITVHDPIETDERHRLANKVIKKHLQQHSQLDQNLQQQYKHEDQELHKHEDQELHKHEDQERHIHEDQELHKQSASDLVTVKTTNPIQPQELPTTEPPVLPLLRRKQVQNRHQSLPPPLQQRKSGLTAISTPPKQPQTLFFQTVEEDRDSNVKSCSVAEPSSVSSAFGTGAETSNAIEEYVEKTPERALHPEFSRRPSDERSGDDSSFRNTGVPERIGKLKLQQDQ